jgi:hypothetical protein
MIRILSPRTHGYVDCLLVLVFLLTPALLGLSGTPAVLSYLFAAGYLALVLTTAFPAGIYKLVPFPLHGVVELVAGPVLVLLPWLLGFPADAPARFFYIVVGLAVFAVWLVTDYRVVRR